MAFWLMQQSRRRFAYGICLANCYINLAQILVVCKRKNLFPLQRLEFSNPYVKLPVEEDELPMKHAEAVELTLAAALKGSFAGRVWREGIGPCLIAVRQGRVVDITSQKTPTMRDLCELESPAHVVAEAEGQDIGSLADLLSGKMAATQLLAPIDLQAVKAAGVTFATSMLERVIEEKARGDANVADAIRADITRLIGDDLSKLVPGSAEAMALKQSLIEKKSWSQYLEVGIGPDPEIFTKSQVMSSVGFGADVGIHPMSSWNNPEPEAVIVSNSRGLLVGATLGNDVNLRDVEGRSALLLSKAKDNNASCALGPFIRFFDDAFSIEDVKSMDITLEVEHSDGFHLKGASNMRKISRSPESLAKATLNRHHQYPDGFVLFCGTVFAPTQDRGEKGQGFTHKHGDSVSVANPKLGALINTVQSTDQCPPWDFGASHLMRNLAARGLI
jgi:fumarylacetoacetate (FAA) hydrolase family protein